MNQFGVRPFKRSYTIFGLAILHIDRYNFINRAVYFMGLVGFVMTLPQIYSIWSSQSAAGVSFSTWCAYLASACVWLAYGIIYKRRQIIVIYSGWVFLEALIVYSIMRFS